MPRGEDDGSYVLLYTLNTTPVIMILRVEGAVIGGMEAGARVGYGQLERAKSVGRRESENNSMGV